MGSPSRNVQYHPPRLSEDRLNLPQPHSPSLPYTLLREIGNAPVIDLINPILRGWTNYFRIGQSSGCFSHVKYWVEKKVRRHLMRQRRRPGFGWKRWSRCWLYDGLGLFSQYRVVYLPKTLPA